MVQAYNFGGTCFTSFGDHGSRARSVGELGWWTMARVALRSCGCVRSHTQCGNNVRFYIQLVTRRDPTAQRGGPSAVPAHGEPAGSAPRTVFPAACTPAPRAHGAVTQGCAHRGRWMPEGPYLHTQEMISFLDSHS